MNITSWTKMHNVLRIHTANSSMVVFHLEHSNMYNSRHIKSRMLNCYSVFSSHFYFGWHLFLCCDRTGDMDQLMEECRSLKDECQTLKNDNKQLSEKLEMLEQQRSRWLATRPVNHTQTRQLSHWALQTQSLLIRPAWPLRHSAIICVNGHSR